MNETKLQRSYHSAVHLDNCVIVIGGRWKDDKMPSTRVIWIYNLYTEEWTDYAIPKEVINKGGAPDPFHAAVAVAVNGTIYTFGGTENTNRKIRNALWTLSKAKTGCFTWSSIRSQHDKASPSPRREHTGWEYAGKLWVFGGCEPSPETYLNDHGDVIRYGYYGYYSMNNQILCFDPNSQKWTNPQCCGTVPAPRLSCASTIIKHKVWLFGGHDQFHTFHDDLFELTMHSLTWTHIHCVQPCPQAGANCTLTAATNNHLVLHGGYGATCFCDTWILDLTSHSWRQYKSRKDHFRRGHTGSLGLNNNVIIIGGCQGGFDYKSCNKVFYVMLEAKSLQQLAARTVYKYQDEINWNCLPNKLISLLGISIKDKEPHVPPGSESLHSQSVQ